MGTYGSKTITLKKGLISMFEKNELRSQLADKIVEHIAEEKPLVVTYETITALHGVEYGTKDWNALFSATGLVRRRLENKHSMIYRCEAGVAFRLVQPKDALKDVVVYRSKRADRQVKRGLKEIGTVDIAKVPEQERTLVMQSQEKMEKDRKTSRAQMAVIRATTR